jgi:hypothetical protein
MTRRLILAGLSLVLAACSMHSSGGETTDERLAEVEVELNRHHGAVMGATSLSDVVAEASNHGANMHRIMDEMGSPMQGMMSHCSGASMRQMSNMMSRMDTQMRDHTAALQDVTSIGSAQALCVSHVAEMREVIAGMRGTLGNADCGMMGAR